MPARVSNFRESGIGNFNFAGGHKKNKGEGYEKEKKVGNAGSKGREQESRCSHTYGTAGGSLRAAVGISIRWKMP